MFEYLCLDFVCSSKLTVILKRRFRQTDYYSHCMHNKRSQNLIHFLRLHHALCSRTGMMLCGHVVIIPGFSLDHGHFAGVQVEEAFGPPHPTLLPWCRLTLVLSFAAAYLSLAAAIVTDFSHNRDVVMGMQCG